MVCSIFQASEDVTRAIFNDSPSAIVDKVPQQLLKDSKFAHVVTASLDATIRTVLLHV